jgi:deoxyribodipyrimidine photo-lyase
VDTLGKKNDLLGQLFWREFYYYICYYYPKVLNGKNYNEKYDKIKWKYNKNHFDKWTNGQTGYPVVDAGMIELKTSGYMHNRARLITSNFLNRMLGMDWRKGELYYATQLTDYDPAVNNGNWQWIASTGTDPKPYFQRLFNPWLQSEKYDKDAEYIKKWLPQLKDIPSKELHEWDKYCDNYDVKKLGYYKPVVEYKKAREESIKMYK